MLLIIRLGQICMCVCVCIFFLPLRFFPLKLMLYLSLIRLLEEFTTMSPYSWEFLKLKTSSLINLF
uniref:Putative ovule protein n=1 Tax=Solanum chacoense TaxID=4108 RepID=A0A0V0GQQ3_SOLCH